MSRITGRNLYVISLPHVVSDSGGVQNFAARCSTSQLSAIWIRLGYGANLDANLLPANLATFTAVQSALKAANIEIWGWHIPRCRNVSAADDEAGRAVDWAKSNGLAGVLVDAEAGDSYFLGGHAEAVSYAQRLAKDAGAAGLGTALSSHDQPHNFPQFPFDVFLGAVQDNAPQVYYSTGDVGLRLSRSITDYQPLEAARNFQDRYKPVGNISIHGDDVVLPSTAACLAKADQFTQLMKSKQFSGYAFWCWDEAPVEIFDFFKTTPP